MRFYTGTQFPAEYRGADLHRRARLVEPRPEVGYRVTRSLKLNGDRAVAYEPFAEGWLQGDNAWGRPVDVLVAARRRAARLATTRPGRSTASTTRENKTGYSEALAGG